MHLYRVCTYRGCIYRELTVILCRPHDKATSVIDEADDDGDTGDVIDANDTVDDGDAINTILFLVKNH